jgi:hypothetical protein
VAGNARCRPCHEEDDCLWEASKHAEAWQALVARGAEADPYCQQCHTTGYGLPGGFVSAGRSAMRRNVGCESCHGPARQHVRNPHLRTTYYGRAKEHCSQCHDRENSPQFAYDDYWSRIEHGTATPEEENSPAAPTIPREVPR